MTEKTVIVLCGVSGAGKTHARERHHELKRLPVVDVAQVYLDDPGINFLEATAGVIVRTKALLKEHDVVVVEGYYIPGTITRGMLAQALGHYAGMDWRLMVEAVEICRRRINASEERVDIRLEILERVWEKHGPKLIDLKRRGYTWEPRLI